MKRASVLIVFPLLLLGFFFVANNSYARVSVGRVLSEATDRLKEKRDELKEKIASRAAIRKEKLAEAKQKVCETRKKIIVNRSNKIAERAQKQFEVFQNHAQRVDDYYNNKLLPKGIIVPNYEALKADIAAKKDAVQVAIEAAKAAAANFDCAGDDPKGQLATFREDMREAIAALKEYRTSIRNFIVAIRTAKANAEATHSASKSGGNQ